jgi:K+-sensing histidine kinase KdpD
MQIPASPTAGIYSNRAQTSIILGFFAIAALFFAIVAIWLIMVFNHNNNIQQINHSDSRRQLIFTMRDAAYQRNIALFRMAVLRDAFARDAEHLRFKAAAVKFIVARRQLLKSQLSDDIKSRWLRLKPGIQQSENLQNTIVDLISEDKNTAALNLIQSRFIPLQRTVSRELTKMLNIASDNIDGNLTTASATIKTQYQVILLLALIATSLGYLIARTVLRRSRNAETLLLNKNRQIHAFTSITADTSRPIEEQLNDVLQLGCRFLAVKCGILIRAEPNDSVTVLSRYCNSQLGDALFEQTTLHRLFAVTKHASNAILTTDTLASGDPTLAEILQRQHITTLITATVYGSVSATVVFMHDKNISPGNEVTDLSQLVSNKLAVLLDQQETLLQLQNTKDAAETASKNRNVFLNHIARKLQSPLSTIIGQGELLYDRMLRDHQSQYLNDLDKIDTSSRQLRVSISNLLDLTQLESGSMEFARQPFDVESLWRQTAEDLDTAISQNDNHIQLLSLNNLGTMVGDPSKTARVLTILLKFASNLTSQKKIFLTAWREHDPEDDWLYWEVKNSAAGICKKQVNQLFKLPTTDDLEKHPFGSQIDLVIGKKLCEQLGGNILVDSKPGSGITFTVCLPCHARQAKEMALDAVENF